MKNMIRVIVWGLIAISTGYVYILAKTTPLKPNITIREEPTIDIEMETKRTLHYLNQLREGAGLVPLISNHKLKNAAKNHASYLIQNGIIGHYEDEEKDGFTGKYGSERSIHAGYETSLVIENISNNNLNHKESVDGLMAAIYHRFGFLDFHIDEIGIGVSQNPKDKSQTAFVYDMGSRKLVELCMKEHKTQTNIYVENICSKKQKIDLALFEKTLKDMRYRNKEFVIYPFAEQEDVPPAFYNELPDPLPDYSVSGFPISISFNESYYKSVEVIDFDLFDADGNKIEDVIVYNHKNDPNHKFKKFEFALFPLKRLEWNSKYRVRVVYEADGKLKRKEWNFKTRSFDKPIYNVSYEQNSFKIKRGEDNIFYFPPQSKNDTLGSIKYPPFLDISFIDKNTIKLVAYSTVNEKIKIEVGKQELELDIVQE